MFFAVSHNLFILIYTLFSLMAVDLLILALRKRVRPKHPSAIPQEFLDQLNARLKEHKVQAVASFGGSWAKGTYLDGDHDIDLFVRFEKGVADSEFANELEKALIGLKGVARIHGSRDYFQLSWQGFSFELVPVMAIVNPEDGVNTTDVSPLHVSYVRSFIDKNPALADDIRLAKLFCKSAKVYGAESYINGFSGHVLDLLVLHYGSFIHLLEAAASWPKKIFIDPTAKHKDASLLPAAKKNSSLVLLDPIQPLRNAAAALGIDAYVLFIERAKAFLANPDESFFQIIPLAKDTVETNHPTLWYELLPKDGASIDVLGTKLFKAHQYFLKQAVEVGFVVLDEGFEFDGLRAICFVVVEQEPLSKEFTRQGPPISQKAAAKNFKQTHMGKKVFEKDGVLFVQLPRLATTLKLLFSHVSETTYVKSRANGAKII